MAQGSSSKPKTTAKVLVIDDEQMIRWSIEQTLRAAGHQVVSAESAASGKALVRQFQPDIVFLDVRLPDQDGLAVLKEMRREYGGKLRVIVMTAFGDGGTTAEAMKLGAYAYLQKPFDFDLIEGTVSSALDEAAGVQLDGDSEPRKPPVPT
jgi:DNA-binding NtrC family response regulator